MAPTQPQPIARWNTARDVWETFETGLFCEHSDVFSETFPTSGMTVGGTAYALPTSEPRTGDSGSSSLLRTPNAYDGERARPQLGQGGAPLAVAADLGHERAGASRDGRAGSADSGVGGAGGGQKMSVSVSPA